MNRSHSTVSATVGATVVAGLVVGLAACGTASSGQQSGVTTVAPVPSAPPDPSSPAARPPTVTATDPGPVVTESNPPGDIPDNQAFVTYRAAAARFTVDVPEGWAQTGSSGSVRFADKLNSISVETAAQAKAPDVATVTVGAVPVLRSTVPRFALQKVSAARLPGGPAVLITYLADSPKDPVTDKVVRDSVEQFVFWRNGTRVTLTLSGPSSADNVDPWARVSESFRWTA